MLICGIWAEIEVEGKAKKRIFYLLKIRGKKKQGK